MFILHSFAFVSLSAFIHLNPLAFIIPSSVAIALASCAFILPSHLNSPTSVVGLLDFYPPLPFEICHCVGAHHVTLFLSFSSPRMHTHLQSHEYPLLLLSASQQQHDTLIKDCGIGLLSFFSAYRQLERTAVTVLIA